MAARSHWICKVSSSSPLTISKQRKLWINNFPDLQPLQTRTAAAGGIPVNHFSTWKAARSPSEHRPTEEKKVKRRKSKQTLGLGRAEIGEERERLQPNKVANSFSVPGCVMPSSCERVFGLYLFLQYQRGFVCTHCWFLALLSDQGKLKLLAAASAWIASRLHSKVPDQLSPGHHEAPAGPGTPERFGGHTAATNLGILLSYTILSRLIALPDS